MISHASNFILKHVPEDFVVQEVLIPSLPAAGGDAHTYYLLKKRGFTTFQAIRRVSDAMQVAPESVSYAGLKDEDAITVQNICTETELPISDIEEFNDRFRGDQENLRLIPLELTGGPIRIGHLIGNSFRITIRGLSDAQVEPLLLRSSSELTFINYYDTQRFGVPDGPKSTHLIGKHLHDGDFSDALDLLKESKTEEAGLARDWAGEPKAFFATLDPRIVHLYYAALASYEWNAGLVECLREHDTGQVRYLTKPPMTYAFTSDEQLIAHVRDTAIAKPLRRFSRDPGFPETSSQIRPGLIQVRFRVVDHGADEFHDGSQKIIVEFFLPSGCYATMALEQFVGGGGIH